MDKIKDNVDIILIEPENCGNIGAVARVIKNFGFKNLVMVNPKVEIDHDTRCRAKHANDVLDDSKIGGIELLDDYDYLVGTTSLVGNDYNMPRVPMNPTDVSQKICSVKKSKIGIVFGRESSGLTNKEVELCDFLVAIPTNPEYSALNLSHSVAILLYEISKHLGSGIGEGIEPISVKEKEIIMTKIHSVLDNIDFVTEEKRKTQDLLWKRILGKAMLSKREAQAVLGFFSKLEK